MLLLNVHFNNPLKVSNYIHKLSLNLRPGQVPSLQSILTRWILDNLSLNSSHFTKFTFTFLYKSHINVLFIICCGAGHAFVSPWCFEKPSILLVICGSDTEHISQRKSVCLLTNVFCKRLYFLWFALNLKFVNLFLKYFIFVFNLYLDSGQCQVWSEE